MALKICIDWGNTLVKVAFFDAQNQLLSKHHLQEGNAVEEIAGLVNTHRPSTGILCSVHQQSNEVVPLLQEKLSYFLQLDADARLPILNAYHADTLGMDRVALATAAHVLFPDKNNLVVSLGTCITYNLVQKTKAFRGGAISPGLHMRLKALHHYTDKLPEVSPEGPLLLLGYDTDTAIRSGVVWGMTAEIEGMIAAFAAEYPDFNVVLTGGDAPLFQGKLKCKIFADPDFLLKGLNFILNTNAPQIR
jgi:type III pantothenate kinase